MNKHGTPTEILLVEDSPTDADLAMRALRQSELIHNVHHVDDGMKALAFLRNEGVFADVPRPDLILLDLNMPRLDGREVLRTLRDDDQLKIIPTVVLTTSDDERDVAIAYRLNSNAYIVKPVDVHEFFAVIRSVTEFWFSAARLLRRE